MIEFRRRLAVLQFGAAQLAGCRSAPKDRAAVKRLLDDIMWDQTVHRLVREKASTSWSGPG
ncbi:MAG: hypothetical protein R3D05_11015 [Dongiaceae bacterium]